MQQCADQAQTIGDITYSATGASVNLVRSASLTYKRYGD